MASQAVLEAVEHYLNTLALCPIPIRTDGTKAPAVQRWKQYQDHRPTMDEAVEMFDGDVGVALVCGPVSGNLELLDFDNGQLFDPWLDRIRDLDPSIPERLIILSTPRGGYHLPYWVEGSPVPGNYKIAQAPELNEKGIYVPKTMIETRGYGGYYLTHPSPAACHETGRTYDWIQGSYDETPTFSWAERDMMHAEAHAFNLWVPPERRVTQHQAREFLGSRPGDIFNREADIEAWLCEAGWIYVGPRGDGGSGWLRPGKKRGLSATLGVVAPGVFYVFSTNAYPFEAGHSYDAFGVFCLLHCNGDFQEGARRVREMGYYDRAQQEDRPATNPPLASSEGGDSQQGGKASESAPDASSEDADNPPAQRVRFVWHKAADYAKLPPPEWAIQGLFEKKELVCLYGLSGMGKSFLGIEWAFRLAEASQWFGRTVLGGNVYYLNMDGGAGLRKRVDAWRRVNAGQSPFDVFITEEHEFDLRNGGSRGDLIYSVQKNGVPCEWLFIDTLAQAIPGADEVSTKDMGNAVGGLTSLRHNLDCGIVLLAHSDKQGLAMRGVASIYNASATVIRIDKADKIITLTCEKQRNDEKFEPISLTVQKDGDSAILTMNDSDFRNPVKAAAAVAKAEVIEQIVRFVTERESQCRIQKNEGRRASAKAIWQNLKLEQRRVSEYLRELVAQGRISQWKRTVEGGGSYSVFGILQTCEKDCDVNRYSVDDDRLQ